MYVSYDYEYGGETYSGSERVIRVGFGIGPMLRRGK